MRWLKKNERAKGRVGLSFNAGGVAVSHYDHAAQFPLNQCQWIAGVSLNNLEPLKRQVDAWGLGGCDTSFVLSAGDYQLLLVDSPSVDDAELQEALRWRVKDLVSYDIDNAVIDYFSLPDDAYRGRSQMLYVVVMPKSLVADIESFVTDAGLTLDCIDIPELVINNLVAKTGDDHALGRAVLCVQEPSSYINLVADQSIYLTRSIELSEGMILGTHHDLPNYAAGMSLDIQRSLDYYESQIGKPPCLKLVICPLQQGESALLSELRSNLAVEIEQIDIAELVVSRASLTPELQADTVMAVAGALREAGS